MQPTSLTRRLCLASAASAAFLVAPLTATAQTLQIPGLGDFKPWFDILTLLYAGEDSDHGQSIEGTFHTYFGGRIGEFGKDFAAGINLLGYKGGNVDGDEWDGYGGFAWGSWDQFAIAIAERSVTFTGDNIDEDPILDYKDDPFKRGTTFLYSLSRDSFKSNGGSIEDRPTFISLGYDFGSVEIGATFDQDFQVGEFVATWEESEIYDHEWKLGLVDATRGDGGKAQDFALRYRAWAHVNDALTLSSSLRYFHGGANPSHHDGNLLEGSAAFEFTLSEQGTLDGFASLQVNDRLDEQNNYAVEGREERIELGGGYTHQFTQNLELSVNYYAAWNKEANGNTNTEQGIGALLTIKL